MNLTPHDMQHNVWNLSWVDSDELKLIAMTHHLSPAPDHQCFSRVWSMLQEGICLVKGWILASSSSGKGHL